MKKNTTTCKVGITFGAFDIMHAGHYLMLKEAKEHCDYLIVGLDEDPSRVPESYRGKKKNKPIQSIEERLIQLQGCRYVDEIVIYHSEDELIEILKIKKPDIRIIGVDWKDKKFTGWDIPMEIYYNSRNHKYSTTELRQRIYDSNN